MSADAGLPTAGFELVMLKFGRASGKRWYASLGCALLLLVVGFAGMSVFETNTDRPHKVWSTKSGDLADALTYYYEWFNEDYWSHSFGFTVMVDKVDAHEDGVGGDILTTDHFLELAETMRLFHTVTVEHDGKQYGGKDLCRRLTNGADRPGPRYMKNGYLMDPSQPTERMEIFMGTDGTYPVETFKKGVLVDLAGAPAFRCKPANCEEKHLASSYATWKFLKCPLVATEFPKFKTHAELIASDVFKEVAERWNDESIGVVGTGSYAGFTGKDQTFETNTIVGKRASVLDMCLALSYGAPDDQISSALPSVQLPCVAASAMACFQQSKDFYDPIMKMIDNFSPTREMGYDMYEKLYSSPMGSLQAASYSFKPSLAALSDEDMLEVINTDKWPRYGNATRLIEPNAYVENPLGIIYGESDQPNCEAPAVAVWQNPECLLLPSGGLVGDPKDCQDQLSTKGFDTYTADTQFVFDENNNTVGLTENYTTLTRRWKCVTPEPVPEVDLMQSGCNDFISIVPFSSDLLFGDTKKIVDGDMTSAAFGFTAWTFDCPEIIRKRRAEVDEFIYDTVLTLEDVNEILKKFKREFEAAANKVSTTASTIVTSTVQWSDLDDDTVPIGPIAVSIVLMLIMLVMAFLHRGKPLHSHVSFVLVGFLIVILTTASSMGIISLFGIRFNMTMSQSLPFFGLGLGIDDLFILVRYYDEIGAKTITTLSPAETTARVLGTGGASVTLTSFCNIAVFCVGGIFIPIVGVSDFCFGAAIVSFCNWVIMMTLIPLLLRRKAANAVQRVAAVRSSGVESAQQDAENLTADPSWTWEMSLVDFLKNTYVPVLAKPAVLGIIVALSLGFTVAMLFAGLNGTDGFVPSDVVAPKHPLHDVYVRLFAHQNTLPNSWVFTDLDYPNQQQEIIELHKTLTALDSSEASEAPWISKVASYLKDMVKETDGDDTTVTMADEDPDTGCPTEDSLESQYPNIEAMFLPTKTSSGACRGKDAQLADKTNVENRPNPFYCPWDTSFKDPEFLPDGMINKHCFYALLSMLDSENFNVKYEKAQEWPFYPPDWTDPEHLEGNDQVLLGGLIGVFQFPTIKEKEDLRRLDGYLERPGAEGDCILDPYGPGCLLQYYGANALGKPAPKVVAPFMLTWNNANMVTPNGPIGTREHQRILDEYWDIIKASPLTGKVFPMTNVGIYSDAFRGLRKQFWVALAIDTGVIFVVTLLLLQSFTGAAIGTLCCLLIVIQLFGVLSFFTEFNFFVSASLLMAVGIAVEFTAHLVAAFFLQAQSIPDPVEKVAFAMSTVAPPILLGAVSTLLCIIGLGFSDVPFIVKYFFGSFVATICVGLLNTMVILPAFLLCIGKILYKGNSNAVKVVPISE